MTFKEEQRLLKEAGEAAHRFAGDTSILDIEIGTKYVRGKPTGRLALRFRVREKKKEKDLKRTEVLPKKVGRFVTDVLNYRVEPQFNRVKASTKVRPLMGGIKIQSGIYENAAHWGTMGCRMLVGHAPFVFTNYHVMYGSVPPEIVAHHYVNNLHVYQNVNRHDNYIGKAAHLFNKELDFATFVTDVAFDRHQSINGVEGLVATWAHPRLQMPVMKSGAATGLTYGIIDGKSVIDTAELTIYLDPRYTNKRGIISDYGDSGAMWVVNDGSDSIKPVALHYARGEGPQWARAKSMASIFASIRTNPLLA